MPPTPGATEFVAPRSGGRTYSSERQVRLGDVDPSATLRLDATARYLQDVASDDAAAGGLDGAWGWLVRRTLIEVRRPAVLDESVTLTTWCSGWGRSWAERTTSVRGSIGADIDAVSIWVQVEVATGRPSQLNDQFREIYGGSCGDRRVSARLGLPGPSDEVDVRPWTVRRTDLDPFHHVNNAANWAFLEEVVAGADRIGRAEMEFAAPVDLGAPVELWAAPPSPDQSSAWLVVEGAVHSAARWVPAPT